MKLIAVTCILSFCFVQMHCVKRGPPPLAPPPDKYKVLLDPNEYYQSDEPNTDVPPIEEHETEPSAHVIETHGPDVPIQQYVNPWGGPYYPPNYSNMPIPWSPYGPLPYGQSPYGQIGYAPVQTEYGILVPDGPPSSHHDSAILPSPSPPPSAFDLVDLLRDLVPRSIAFLLAKWSAFIVSLFSLVAFGGIITTAICSFTPFCTISFAALPFAALRNSIASKHGENANAGLGSIDRVRRAVDFVSSAIEKYEKLQQTATAQKPRTAHN